MSVPSPRNAGIESLQNYISLDSPDADARSSRDTALTDELVGNLVFDDSRVFQRLNLNRCVSPQFVTDCAKAFQTDENLLNARRELDEIIAAAMSKSPEELEAEEKDGSEEKENMYKPLKVIFQHVETFNDSSGTLPKYSFESMDSTTLKSDSSTWGFPKGSPDFVLFDRSSSTSAIPSRRKHILWRQTRGFCKIKPTSQQGPKSTNPEEVVKPVVLQAADDARLHLSARPFQLFSVGVLIFGSEFCVAIFDHAGVLFSPIHDMWKETEIFIKVIRSLTCPVSSLELGQDLTVTTLPDEQHEIWRSQTKHLGRRETPEDFPTFVITMGGFGPGPSWYTIGLPIWTSVSLLGRGTSVWLVRENGEGPVLVLKNTWRSVSRTSESMIYGSIEGDHPALAKLHGGADVLFPREQRSITTCNLRGGDDIDGDICLHRLLLNSRGRPLWEYESEKELVQGIRAALSAHQFLCDQGILHCDISAGNIMLSAETPPDAGAEGFLMDLEFARLGRSIDTIKMIPIPPVRKPGGSMTAPTVRSHTTFGPDVLRDAVMTGTAQFMATELLLAMLDKNPIMHEPRHDIESFIYVLGYSVTRKVVLHSWSLDQTTHERLYAIFHSTFGRMRLFDVYQSRKGQGPLLIADYLPGLMSEPMVELFKDLEDSLALSKIQKKHNRQPLTHATVLSLLDEAIGKMV